jgi:hypothetical protein
MLTDHDAIAAAEARLAEAQADVERLRGQLRAEQTEAAAPRLVTWEDGVQAAKKRFPGRTRSEVAAAGADTGTNAGPDFDPNSPYIVETPAARHLRVHGFDITSVEGAKAEARRRGAARKSNNR